VCGAERVCVVDVKSFGRIAQPNVQTDVRTLDSHPGVDKRVGFLGDSVGQVEIRPPSAAPLESGLKACLTGFTDGETVLYGSE
jgi:hypothetical protein